MNPRIIHSRWALCVSDLLENTSAKKKCVCYQIKQERKGREFRQNAGISLILPGSVESSRGNRTGLSYSVGVVLGKGSLGRKFTPRWFSLALGAWRLSESRSLWAIFKESLRGRSIRNKRTQKLGGRAPRQNLRDSRGRVSHKYPPHRTFLKIECTHAFLFLSFYDS